MIPVNETRGMSCVLGGPGRRGVGRKEKVEMRVYIMYIFSK